MYIYTPKCCSLTVHGSHTLLQIPPYLTQFLTQNDQNSTRKSLHVSDNMVYSQICHKYIHIMGRKDQTSKEIATCLISVSPRICCEQAAAGMLRVFPVHFVPFQFNSTHCNMHGSRAASENCMKCKDSVFKGWALLFCVQVLFLMWIYYYIVVNGKTIKQILPFKSKGKCTILGSILLSNNFIVFSVHLTVPGGSFER